MLTRRARTYLSSLRRNDEWNVTPEKLAAYFAKQKFPVSNGLLKALTEYLGYELTIHGDPGHTFMLNFISKQEVSRNAEIEFYSIGNGYLLEFGSHATAQFTFYITDLGAICTWGPEVGDEPNIICSSVENYIEEYALRNELAYQVEHTGYYHVLDLEGLDSVLYQQFIEIPECNDAYSYWCSSESLTVVKGTWLHEPAFYFHLYGRSRRACAEFVEQLKSANIIG